MLIFKKLFPLLLLISGLNGFSQESIPPVKTSKFRIGVNASLEGVHRRQIMHFAIIESGIESWNIEHIEKSGGFTASIRMGYAIGRRTDLELGLGYSLRQFAWDINRYRSQQPSWPWIGRIPERALGVRQLQYLEIPLRASHMIGNGSVRWISSIGITTGLLVWEPEPVPPHEYYQSALFIRDPRKMNVSLTLSSGIALRPGDRSDLRLEPTLAYGMSLLTDSSVFTKMWSVGLNFGWYRRF